MLTNQDILDIQNFYHGYSITGPQGNNAFSFQQRKNKEIYISPFEVGTIDSLCIGEKVVFSEIVDGIEKNVFGLNGVWHLQDSKKNIFIFDNHNHAFFFWMIGWMRGIIPARATLVHVDQHKDMREPEVFFDTKDLSMQKISHYTNNFLNVGNFIKPALKIGIFSDVVMVDNKDAFKVNLPQEFILDIDCDIFSKEMAYIDEDYKIEKIRSWISQSSFITIATSPFFMDQTKALKILKELLIESR